MYIYNSTIVGNRAFTSGGGLSTYTSYSSIIWYNGCNAAPQKANYSGTLVVACCTTPKPITPRGSFANEPLFVNASVGDFHLQSNSPCINAGSSAQWPFDLEGNPRVTGGAVDVGAYEFQTPTSPISYVWLQQSGFPVDGSADFSDPDADGMNNYGEWRSDTIPTNSASVLRLTSVTNIGTGVRITWQGGPMATFTLERATNLTGGSNFTTVRSNLLTSFTDTTATNLGPYFYRVRAE